MPAKFKALSTWPGKPSVSRQTPPFKTDYTEALRLLNRELRMVGAVEPTVEIALHEQQFTREGLPYREATPTHPGVVVRFAKRIKNPNVASEQMLLPLCFKCDTYTTYKANLRAIAIALEDLRRIDRYGVTSHAGEQWIGFKALPAPGPSHEEVVTVEAAARFLADASDDYRDRWQLLMSDPAKRKDAYRLAAAANHPDTSTNHNAELWNKLQAAKALLDRELGE